MMRDLFFFPQHIKFVNDFLVTYLSIRMTVGSSISWDNRYETAK